MGTCLEIQGAPNQNLPIQMAITLKICISDGKAKVYFWKIVDKTDEKSCHWQIECSQVKCVLWHTTIM